MRRPDRRSRRDKNVTDYCGSGALSRPNVLRIASTGLGYNLSPGLPMIAAAGSPGSR